MVTAMENPEGYLDMDAGILNGIQTLCGLTWVFWLIGIIGIAKGGGGGGVSP